MLIKYFLQAQNKNYFCKNFKNMDLKGILSISGKSGLFKHVSQTKNGIIVESFIDKKRSHAFASAKISALQDIAIYTASEDKALIEVFQNIYKKEDGKQSINPKTTSDELKKYFKEVLPDYDEDRVYVSDIKRVVGWYNQLQERGLVDMEVVSKDDDKVETEELKTEKKEETEV